MNNLEAHDPQLARKLERRAAKVAEYELWLWIDNVLSWVYTCDTIEEARNLWLMEKLSNDWDNWELRQGAITIKKGVF